MSIQSYIFRAIPFILAIQLAGCNNSSVQDATQKSEPLPEEIADGNLPYKKLSTYQFFQGELANLNPREEVIPYEPASSLFTDYALKKRFIKIPSGQKAEISEGELQYPIGTILIKNFYFTEDLRDQTSKQRIIETRLLILEENGWEAFPYIWNEEQTEAVLKVVGGEKTVKFTDLKGEDQVINYLIPNKNQCKTCHNKSEVLAPIGAQIKHLNHDLNYQDTTLNQLAHWQEFGILEGFEGKEAYPSMINYQDESQALSKRAMAYLDVNCSHCHSAEGPASTSGLYLTFDQEDQMKLGVMKTPVAAGNGAGSFDYDIVPGKADESIITHRMNSTEVGIAMPELGRTTVHKEGVKLIKDWINSMN